MLRAAGLPLRCRACAAQALEALSREAAAALCRLPAPPIPRRRAAPAAIVWARTQAIRAAEVIVGHQRAPRDAPLGQNRESGAWALTGRGCYPSRRSAHYGPSKTRDARLSAMAVMRACWLPAVSVLGPCNRRPSATSPQCRAFGGDGGRCCDRISDSGILQTLGRLAQWLQC